MTTTDARRRIAQYVELRVALVFDVLFTVDGRRVPKRFKLITTLSGSRADQGGSRTFWTTLEHLGMTIGVPVTLRRDEIDRMAAQKKVRWEITLPEPVDSGIDLDARLAELESQVEARRQPARAAARPPIGGSWRVGGRP